jgi:hypothetical protein
MNDHTSYHTTPQLKTCKRCNAIKHISEFYTRSGRPNEYLGECKACYKERGRNRVTVRKDTPMVGSEILAINALNHNGIHALPGKALQYAHVDVIAFGCVRIEVKYAKLDRTHHREKYTFQTTPRQGQRGLLADVVMLICDDGDTPTFHLFRPDDEVFFIKGRLKTGFTFTPGAMAAEKHGNNRVVMTQPMMDAARNRWSLVWSALKAQSDALKQEGA